MLVEGDSTGLKQVHNQSDLEALNGVEEFGLVGDFVKFGVDGRRPLNTAFDSVLIDTATGKVAGDVRPPGVTRVSAALLGDLFCLGADRGHRAYP